MLSMYYIPIYLHSSSHPFKVTLVQKVDVNNGFSPAVRIDTCWSLAQSRAYERLVLCNEPLPQGWKEL